MARDPFFGSVSLLLHCDGSDNGTTFTDQKSHTVTRSGAVTKTGTKKYGTASGYFVTGSSQYLTCADSADWAFGSGDFTLELWFKQSTTAGAGVFRCLLSQRNNLGQDYSFVVYLSPTGYAVCKVSSSGTGDAATASVAYTQETSNWHHLAVVRSGSNLTVYVDGTGGTSVSVSGVTLYNSSSLLAIGADGSGTSNYWDGYLDDIRITKGIARYTGNFTPPTAAFEDTSTMDATVADAASTASCAAPALLSGVVCVVSNTTSTPTCDTVATSTTGRLLYPDSPVGSGVAITVALPVPGDTHITSVGFLLHCDGANDGTSFPEFRGKSITAYGNARTRTGTKKYGTASAYFDGTGDYLDTPSSQDFNFGSGDFTVEMWLYHTPGVGETGFFIASTAVTANAGWLLNLESSTLTYTLNGVPGPLYSSNIPQNQWVHVALVRSSGTVKLYQNGVSGATSTNTANISQAGNLYLGRGHASSTGMWKGYIDEVRITKGVARYTSNFTPPSAAFPEFNSIVDAVSSDVSGGAAIATLSVYVDSSTYLWVADSSASGVVTAVAAVNNNVYLTPTALTSAPLVSGAELQVSRLLSLPAQFAPTATGFITTLAYNVVPLSPVDVEATGSLVVRSIVTAKVLVVVDTTSAGVVDPVSYPGVMRPASLTGVSAVAPVTAVVDQNTAILRAPVKFSIVQGAAPQRVTLQLGLYIGPGGELSAPVEFTVRDRQEGTLTAGIQSRVYEVGSLAKSALFTVAAYGQPSAGVTFTVNEVWYGSLRAGIESRVYESPAGSAGQIKAVVRFCIFSNNHLFFT